MFRKNTQKYTKSTEKYVTFPFLIEKEVTRIGKNGEKVSKNISYMLRFIDSASFIRSSLSNLLNNHSEGVREIKCKYGQNDKKNVKIAELDINTVILFLNTQNLHII